MKPAPVTPATRSTSRATRSSTRSPPPRRRSRAVSEAMTGLDGGPIRIRVGIHTGEPALDPPKYVGIDVHRAARIMSSAHGGQVVLSPSTVALLDPGSVELKDLGRHRLKDLSAPIPLHQLSLDGLPTDFPPLKTLYRSNLPIPATPFLGRERRARLARSPCSPLPTCACSPSPGRAAPARRGSRSRPLPTPPTATPTASSGCHSRRFATRRS